MATIDKDIRAALETKLADIPNVPSIAYENVSFSPTTGENYLEVTYTPITRRPSVRGLNPQQRYDGIFTINCYVPEGAGPAAADTLAKDVMETYEATTKLTQGTTTVNIEFAERRQGIVDSPYYFIPVVVTWYAYK
jgi:hypothetical protein